MRFPISLACLGLILSAALGTASFVQPAANQAKSDNSSNAVVAYRGSGRIQW
jgi:hypothetical protein